jgi:hypothetical protein
MITPSVTFPDEAAKYPRAHRCRPENCLAYCASSILDVEDVQGRNDIMLNYVDEDIVVTHIGVLLASISLSKSI